MVEFISVHGFQKTNLIGYFREMRQVIGDPGARFTVLFELCLVAQHIRYPGDEGKALAFQQRGRAGFAVQLIQRGFVIKQFQPGATGSVDNATL